MKRGDKLNAMTEHLRKFPRSTYEDLEKNWEFITTQLEPMRKDLEEKVS